MYHYVDPFNLFDLDLGNAAITATIFVALVLSVMIYGNCCKFIFPFGLFTWLDERLSLARICIDPTRCNQCNACIRAYPSEATHGRANGKLFAAECYSCARCLNVCAQDAIAYGWRFDSRAGSVGTGFKFMKEK